MRRVIIGGTLVRLVVRAIVGGAVAIAGRGGIIAAIEIVTILRWVLGLCTLLILHVAVVRNGRRMATNAIHRGRWFVVENVEWRCLVLRSTPVDIVAMLHHAVVVIIVVSILMYCLSSLSTPKPQILCLHCMIALTLLLLLMMMMILHLVLLLHLKLRLHMMLLLHTIPIAILQPHRQSVIQLLSRTQTILTISTAVPNCRSRSSFPGVVIIIIIVR